MPNFIVAITFLLLATASQAAIVTWTLDNVVLSDGQTLEGSFDYDHDANTFVGVSITNSGEGEWAASTWDRLLNPDGFCYELSCFFNDSPPAAGDVVIRLELMEPLTGTSASFSGDNPAFWQCITFRCTSLTASFDNPYVVSGKAISPAYIPLPPAAWLFGSALAGLGWLRRKQSH